MWLPTFHSHRGVHTYCVCSQCKLHHLYRELRIHSNPWWLRKSRRRFATFPGGLLEGKRFVGWAWSATAKKFAQRPAAKWRQELEGTSCTHWLEHDVGCEPLIACQNCPISSSAPKEVILSHRHLLSIFKCSKVFPWWTVILCESSDLMENIECYEHYLLCKASWPKT